MKDTIESILGSAEGKAYCRLAAKWETTVREAKKYEIWMALLC